MGYCYKISKTCRRECLVVISLGSFFTFLLLRAFHNTTDLVDKQKQTGLHVSYTSLANCAKPEYLAGYRAHCWLAPSRMSEWRKATSTEMPSCFPNIHLLGLRKSGTTDFSKFFRNNIQVIFQGEDYLMPQENLCPVEYFAARGNVEKMAEAEQLKDITFYNSGPGNMIMYTPIKRNSTHVIVLSTAQYIAFMATPSTKFYIQLRNPSDRFISYVFHRQRFALEFKDVMLEQMTADYIDTFAKFATQNLTECFQELGELGCFYTVADEDRMAMLLHSVYIIPLLEVFKFIPHHQVTLSTMEEYSSSRVAAVKAASRDLFKIQVEKEILERLDEAVENKGVKNTVWKSTLTHLDEFFRPYNHRLAQLLGDEKWLFRKQRI